MKDLAVPDTAAGAAPRFVLGESSDGVRRLTPSGRAALVVLMQRYLNEIMDSFVTLLEAHSSFLHTKRLVRVLSSIIARQTMALCREPSSCAQFGHRPPQFIDSSTRTTRRQASELPSKSRERARAKRARSHQAEKCIRKDHVLHISYWLVIIFRSSSRCRSTASRGEN